MQERRRFKLKYIFSIILITISIVLVIISIGFLIFLTLLLYEPTALTCYRWPTLFSILFISGFLIFIIGNYFRLNAKNDNKFNYKLSKKSKSVGFILIFLLVFSILIYPRKMSSYGLYKSFLNVYSRGKCIDSVFDTCLNKIEEADVFTFKIEDGVTKDKNNVYDVFCDGSCGVGVVKGADVDTFESINVFFQKDSSNIYSRRDRLDADYNSFEIIEDKYAKDKDKVFIKEHVLGGADPHSFDIIDNTYSKDKNKVYYKARILQSALPASFELLNEYYSRDSENVFYGEVILGGADSQTFEIVNEFYNTDSKNVFFRTEIVEEIEIESFEVIEDVWAKDSNYIFFVGIRSEIETSELEAVDEERFMINGEWYEIRKNRNTLQYREL